MNITEKKEYFVPQIERINLDNEISLALESTPPFGPGEAVLKKLEYNENNPLNTNMG